MITATEIPLQILRLEPNEIATERVPLSPGETERMDLVVVVDGNSSFNFLIKRPKSGMPPLIKLGDMILRYADADRTHPDCVIHQYAVVQMVALEVPEDTLITYPGRTGPSRTLADWQRYAEQPPAAERRPLGRLRDLLGPRTGPRLGDRLGERLDQLARGYR